MELIADGLAIAGSLTVVARECGRAWTWRIRNVKTAAGLALYAGLLAGDAQAAVTGMQLGTGDEPPTPSGGGAVLDVFLSGSGRVLDPGYPLSDGAACVWRCTWAEGSFAGVQLAEVVLVTKVIASDTAATLVETAARALLPGLPVFGASASLEVTWRDELLNPVG